MFLVTDTTDFYYNGRQYFSIGFDEPKRAYKTTGIMNNDEARSIITRELSGFFGSSIMEMEIQNPIDISTDPKFVLISHAITLSTNTHKAGCIPEGLVNQYRKIKSAYNLLRDYEDKHSVHYDVIFRGRFDLMYGHRPLNLRTFDYKAFDVFVPGPGGDAPIIYDWCAFGNRRAMNLALTIYDRLGFTLSNRLFRCLCKNCGLVRTSGSMEACSTCTGNMEYEEMSLSSEYHLYRLFKDNYIMYQTASGVSASPYRYS